MAGYARIQRWCLYVGLGALALCFVLMVISSQDAFKAAYDREAHGAVRRLRRATRRRSTRRAEPAWRTPAASSTRSASARAPSLLVPFMLFFLLYPNWGSTLYGEVRGAGDFRKVLNGMLGGLWATVGLAIVFVFLAAKTFGWTFFNASNVHLRELRVRLHDATPRSSRSGASRRCWRRT